jgi:hypothetical protein
MIWNDFMTNNPVQNNAFGFTFMYENFSDGSYNPNVATSTTDSITHGPFGPVTEVKWSNGTCMTMNPSQNPSVKGHVWRGSAGQTDTAVCCVTSRWKCGKIASIGDSSPPDDGTGNTTLPSSLYTGYTGDASGNHRPWLMNIMIWLAEATNCGSANGVNFIDENNSVSIFPNPSNGKIKLTIDQADNSTIVPTKVYNVLGKIIFNSNFQMDASSNFQIDLSSQPDGIYFLQTESGGNILTKKIVIQH